MSILIFIVIAVVLASLPTARSVRRVRSGDWSTPAPLLILIKGALAGLALGCVLWVTWEIVTALNVRAFVVWLPSLSIVGIALAQAWWRTWRFEDRSPSNTRGGVHTAFAGAQAALAIAVLGLLVIINLPATQFPDIERQGLGWALVSLIPPALAWIVAFQIPRLARREPHGAWAVFLILGGVALLLALTMVLPGMVIGAGFRGGQIALLGLPWTFVCTMIVPAVGVGVLLASPRQKRPVC